MKNYPHIGCNGRGAEKKDELEEEQQKIKKRKMILRQHLKKFEVYQQGYD